MSEPTAEFGSLERSQPVPPARQPQARHGFTGWDSLRGTSGTDLPPLRPPSSSSSMVVDEPVATPLNSRTREAMDILANYPQHTYVDRATAHSLSQTSRDMHSTVGGWQGCAQRAM